MKTCLAWSGGKDAALALAELRGNGDHDVVKLLTTVSAEYNRSTIHGVRRELYTSQAAALGLPIELVELPKNPSDDQYAARMRSAHRDLAASGIEQVAFGDINLEDVRAYREDRLADVPVQGSWPIWGRETSGVVEAFLAAGFEAIVVCVDGEVLDQSYVGRTFDRSFIDALPSDVDPAGENGEFHTFVTDGPVFDYPVPVVRGERVTRTARGGTFHYCDLVADDRG